MWAQKAGNRYRFTERFKYQGGYKTVSVTMDKDTPQSRKAAQNILFKRIAVYQGKPLQGVTLAEAVREYNEYQRSHVRPSTYLRNENVLGTILKHLDPGKLLNELSAGYIKDRLPDDNPSSYNGRLVRLKALLRWCYDHDLIDSVEWLVKLKPLPTDRKEKLQEKYLERNELKTLLNSMQVEKWRAVTAFLALSGLRVGEMLALNDADVAETIRVNKTYVLTLHQVQPFTKTDCSVREVYVQEELKPIIETLRSLRPRGSRFFPFKYDAFRKYLIENSLRSIGRPITPHALRHTMTSLFAAEGIPLEVISRRLGHSDSAVTRQVYFHVTQGLRDMDARLIRNLSIL